MFYGSIFDLPFSDDPFYGIKLVANGNLEHFVYFNHI